MFSKTFIFSIHAYRFAKRVGGRIYEARLVNYRTVDLDEICVNYKQHDETYKSTDGFILKRTVKRKLFGAGNFPDPNCPKLCDLLK